MIYSGSLKKIRTKLSIYKRATRHIFIYRVLRTNKISDIGQMQTLVYFMKHVFVLKNLQMMSDFSTLNNRPNIFFFFLRMRMKIWCLFFWVMIHNFTAPQLTHFPKIQFFSETGKMGNKPNALLSGHLNSLNEGIPCTPRSPNLTARDFFLWEYFKSKIFEVNPPRTI